MSPTYNLALSIDSNIRRADPTTIKNKFLVGYQGWFYCHGDGEPVGPGHHGWIHWFTHPVPHGGHLNIDYWPDTSQYSRDELFLAPGFKHEDGSPAFLFSSRNPKTVQKHFHWMAENGVDGAFLQRFLGLCDVVNRGNEGNRRIRDEIGDRVQQAAERAGRVYAIMYDVTGVQPERVQEIIEADWRHLLREKRVLNSPNYLREDGKPVIAIWGFGFDDRKHTPAQVRAVTSFFRNSTPGGAYLMAGTPAHWRTSDSDADRNPEFVNTWLESFDAISPWTVGRYSDQTSADAFAEDRIHGDVTFIGDWTRARGRRVDYVPVVHPGGSGFNLSHGQWPRNGAPREGGRFLWRQIYNARRLGARTMYGAMWDEYDEGTQFLPAITKTVALPHDENHKFTLIAYDVDGYDVPPDWYMRIAGYGSALVKGERSVDDRFPEKELRDWQPKFEVHPPLRSLVASGSGSGSGSTGGQAQFSGNVSRLADPAKDENDVPPPPYSPSVEESDGATSATLQGPTLPTLTRPSVPRQDLRPPPPVPPRPDSQSSHPSSSQYGLNLPPVIPFNSRPKPPSNTLPHSPVSLEHRSPVTGHHDQAHPSSQHLSASQPASVQSSYPRHMPPPQIPTPFPHSTGGPGSPSAQPPMLNYPPMSPPGGPWYPPPNPAYQLSDQDWNYPPPIAPPSFPPPGQPPTPYGYQSGYSEPLPFPGGIRPMEPYGFAMPQAPSILEPQQHNPGLPPPLRPHPSDGNIRSEYAPPQQHGHVQRNPSPRLPHSGASHYSHVGGRRSPSPPRLPHSGALHYPHAGGRRSPSPPRLLHSGASHHPHKGGHRSPSPRSPHAGASPHPHARRRRSSSPSPPGGHATRKESLINRLSTVSAAGSKVLSKLTK